MIELKNIQEYRALGYTQEYHGIPEYKILYAIEQLRREKHLATTNRIARLLGTYTDYVKALLMVYWGWNYVRRKNVKTSTNKNRKADGCIYHWDLSASGKRKLEKRRKQFGEIIVV